MDENRKSPLDLATSMPFEDLPETSGDVESVLAEMDAQQAFFDASTGQTTHENVMNLASYALRVRCKDKTLEDRLATFSLAYSLGETKEELIPHRWSRATKWAKRSREDLVVGWMRWIAWRDAESVETALKRMEKDLDTSIEALAIQYWATAIQALTKEDLDTARRYFERAMDVSSQFGFACNPPICWTYTVSFLRPPFPLNLSAPFL